MTRLLPHPLLSLALALMWVLLIVAETISVMIQVAYFKYTRRKYGVGRRIFRMAPLHHHFQMAGWKEPKIVFRFVIVAILFALLSLSTLKLR